MDKVILFLIGFLVTMLFFYRYDVNQRKLYIGLILFACSVVNLGSNGILFYIGVLNLIFGIYLIINNYKFFSLK